MKYTVPRRYVIQHRTTGDYLGLVPSLNQDPQNPPDVSKLHVTDLDAAATYSTEISAKIEHKGLAEFAGAYDVKTVEISSMLDTPRLLPMPRARGQEEPQYPEDMF